MQYRLDIELSEQIRDYYPESKSLYTFFGDSIIYLDVEKCFVIKQYIKYSGIEISNIQEYNSLPEDINIYIQLRDENETSKINIKACGYLNISTHLYDDKLETIIQFNRR